MMSSFRITWLPLILVSLVGAGCSASPESVTAPSPIDTPPAAQQPSGCIASGAQWAIGQSASDDLLDRARLAAGAETARFLRPNQPITTEYLGSRLNLSLDGDDIVRSLYCG
jgi:hypothetical protein